jgi:hypothetical protein
MDIHTIGTLFILLVIFPLALYSRYKELLQIKKREEERGKKDTPKRIRKKAISKYYDFEKEELVRKVEVPPEDVYLCPSTDALGPRIALPIIKVGEIYEAVQKAKPGDEISAYLFTDKYKT